MRTLHCLAFALTVLATASSSYAQDPQSADGSSTPAPKKVSKSKKKKKAAVTVDASATVTADAAPAQPVLVASNTPPPPAAAPPPVAPSPAPAPAPVTSTTTTTSAVTARTDRDRTRDDVDDMPPVSAAPLLGLSTNGLGFGLGARAGYTFPMKLYVGGQFMYHFGTSPVPEVSESAFYPSAEVGYEFHPVNGLMVRPYGGLGMMFVHVSTDIPGAFNVSATGHSFVFYPACTVTYTIPRTDVFVGGDARLLLATSYAGDYGGVAGFGASFGVFATAGMRF